MENHFEKLLSVCFVKCCSCGCECAYTIENADTDMTSLYCSSVYDSENKQLIIAELTNDEYMYGCKDRLDKRVNGILNTDKFHFIDHRWVTDGKGDSVYSPVCPYCGSQMSETGQCSLGDYIKSYPPPLLVKINGEKGTFNLNRKEERK